MRGFNVTDSRRTSVFKWGDEGCAGICDIVLLKLVLMAAYVMGLHF